MNGSDEVLFVAGSYTDAYGPFRAVGEGVSLLALAASNGRLVLLDQLSGLPNPAYLRVDPGRGLCYAALEMEGSAAVAAIAIDRAARRLRVMGITPRPGSLLCHLDIHPGGDWLAGACYGSGHVFACRLDGDGMPGAAGATVQRTGRSVHPVRQTCAHPHAARFSPDGRWLVVPDLGTDELACYLFDPGAGGLGQAVRVHRAPAGSGPRLVLFSPDMRHLVLVRELASTVCSFAWEDGQIRSLGEHSALFAPHDGPNTLAGLRWHPSGQAFAVSNRGADRIALFHFDPASGAIEPWCEHASGGAKPRDFEFSPCGAWLLVANQDSDRVAVLALPQRGEGRMRETGLGVSVRSPSCVRAVQDSAAATG